MTARKKIRIVNKTKLFTSAAVILLAVTLIVSLVFSLTGDKIEKQIEKLEDSKITVLDRRIESSVKNESSVNISDTITFTLVYYYQTEDKEISSFEVTKDITIAISGETEDAPSTVAKAEENLLTILPTAKTGDTVEVTLSHKYAGDTTFRFSVGDTEVIE